jgi:hypothetical protein
VSDGLNSAAVTTASFQIPEHSPTAAFVSPEDGAAILEHQPIDLRAIAHDVEDGLLGDSTPSSRFTWKLGSRVLGQGATLHGITLPAGRHVISVEARDRTGRVGVAHAKILVQPDADRDGRPDWYEHQTRGLSPFMRYDGDIDKSGYARYVDKELADRRDRLGRPLRKLHQ